MLYLVNIAVDKPSRKPSSKEAASVKGIQNVKIHGRELKKIK